MSSKNSKVQTISRKVFLFLISIVIILGLVCLYKWLMEDIHFSAACPPSYYKKGIFADCAEIKKRYQLFPSKDFFRNNQR